MEGQQIDGKKEIRNDRLIAVAEANQIYANIKRRKDLPKRWLEELQDFLLIITILKISSTDY